MANYCSISFILFIERSTIGKQKEKYEAYKEKKKAYIKLDDIYSFKKCDTINLKNGKQVVINFLVNINFPIVQIMFMTG